MIEKILSIKNIGRFTNYNLKTSEGWNGELAKINIIYAPNGSGKTTLSLILKSLKTKDSKLIEFKKSFNSNEEPYVSILNSDSVNKRIEFKNKMWSSKLDKIDVFDIHYIEDYLFIGSRLYKKTKENLFALLLGQKGLEFKNKCKPLINKKDALVKKIRFAENKEKEKIQQKIIELELQIAPVLKEYFEFSKDIFDQQISLTNEYLNTFAPYIKLTDFSYYQTGTELEIFRIFIKLNVRGNIVEFLTPDLTKKRPNAKFALSEGDKSAIAISFFLARLGLNNTDNKIVVFDDPLSSFDHNRRNTTINNLAKIAPQCEQFFLFTHDIYFARDFAQRINFEKPLNLKIYSDGNSSQIDIHDIYNETLSSFHKDLQTLKRYIDKPINTLSENREVIRCIRPILEGQIKNKYFYLPDDYWLGDIISTIRNSNNTDKINKLFPLIDKIIELNDYTKGYHHSSPSGINNTINPQELRNYVNLLLDVIYEI